MSIALGSSMEEDVDGAAAAAATGLVAMTAGAGARAAGALRVAVTVPNCLFPCAGALWW